MMKNKTKYSLLLLGAVMMFVWGCDKKTPLPFYSEGNDITLSLESTSLKPAPADSDNVVLNLSWTNPEYPFDASKTKYVIQIAPNANQFDVGMTGLLTGKTDTGFIAKELNAYVLSIGGDFGEPFSLVSRVTASYPNNNDQKISNVVSFTYTPYKVPPKVGLPTSGELFLVGDATANGWNIQVPLPTYQFSRIDETTFGGIFHLEGGGQYLVVPNYGEWSKYSITDMNANDAQEKGSFGAELANNFPGPADPGFYKIILDFQRGTYSVTPWKGHLPDNLYIVGDASPDGWQNDEAHLVPSQQFDRLNSSEFELTIPLRGGGQYLIIPIVGSWDHKYAIADPNAPGLPLSGELGYDFANNMPGPADEGTYHIKVNFAEGEQGMFSLEKQ